MTGGAALAALLRGLAPELHGGVYVFASVPPAADLAGLDVVATVREPEG